ncbi:uncharacterized protein C8Q71DRAFT_169770 [Rhodofomes roseus]|uniref:Mitochondrial distribution and morphology protein 34 n=1 Tax=Rhodofomes roseus TaxID=34475 RepID=A0ABQ8KA28_9APHY|nr:uncharacterized protein C8Q71DRAFT_169770 [Rhodofomes roseus]KAH9833676.1 hypothetical protein C8Q71DRAFT_169770 [Rhodofomes roseus]
MSFTFKWPRFSDQFHADAIQMLTSALNKGNKPPVIADKIEVVELEMGTQPPELEIRDIGELTMDQFRGIFRLTYSGDAHIVLRTKVQANPLNHKQPDIHLMGGSRGMLAAKQPLVVPMLLRLSGFKLNSYVVLVVSRQKGITLVFKTDPLQNVDINSTFDSIAVIQKFIQREIEGQLRQMFREDLPGIIHRLSQQWVKAKVEAPYLAKRPSPTTAAAVRQRQREREQERDLDSMSTMSNAPSYYSSYSQFPPPVGLQPSLMPRTSLGSPSFTRPRTASVVSGLSASRRPTPSVASSPASATPMPTPAPDSATSSFPDIENFDPTYGLRPEGLPKKSVFSGFRSLFAPSKGLADLAEEPSDVDDSMDETGSFGTGQWDDFLSDYNPPPPPSVAEPEEDAVEYETVPAVGGGTIMRPRVYHSQSQILSPMGEDSPSGEMSSIVGRPASRTAVRPPPLNIPSSSGSSRYGPNYNPYFAGATPFTSRTPSRLGVDSWREDTMEASRSFSAVPPVPPLYRSPPSRPGSPSSLQSRLSSDMTRSVPTPPPSEGEAGIRITRPRRLSAASSTLDRFQPSSPMGSDYTDHDPKIVLRPFINNSISKLSTLSHSNHTLSPYTRTLEHFTVRSVPPRDASSTGPASSVEKQPIKAKRKRMHRLGGKPAKTPGPGGAAVVDVDLHPQPPSSPVPLSEFDVSEMDRYFRSNDDLLPRYPDHIAPPNARRRVPYQS